MTGPAWKVAARLLVSTNQLTGELASWAVQQSPYDVPDSLEQALRDFRAAWPEDPELPGCRYWDSYEDLYAALEKVFCETPSIRAWNDPKSGHGAQIVFSDRYSGPAPDDDFIDLGALANNVAREVWKDELAFKAFNDDFDARWEAEHGVKPFAQGGVTPAGDETGTGSVVEDDSTRSPSGDAPESPHP